MTTKSQILDAFESGKHPKHIISKSQGGMITNGIASRKTVYRYWRKYQEYLFIINKLRSVFFDE